MSKEQIQLERRPTRMKNRHRRQLFYRIEPEPVLSDDLFKRASREGQNIAASVIVTAGDQPVLVTIWAKADDRDRATQGIINLARVGPSHRCDNQSRLVEEPATGEILLQRGPVHRVEARVLAGRKLTDQGR